MDLFDENTVEKSFQRISSVFVLIQHLLIFYMRGLKEGKEPSVRYSLEKVKSVENNRIS